MTEENERTQPSSHSGNDRMGWGELVEDLVGVNLRGLRTLAASIFQPASLFTAARSRDWQGVLYSPSVRIYVFILAVIVFFQFIWGDSSSIAGQGLAEELRQYEDLDPRFAEPEAVERVMDAFAVAFPVLSLILSMLVALIVRIWGQGTRLLASIRLYFAAILPSTLLQLFGTIGLARVEDPAGYDILLFGVLLVYMLADIATVFRGLAPVHSIAGRLWRAALFGLMNATVIAAASIVSGTIAFEFTYLLMSLEAGTVG